MTKRVAVAAGEALRDICTEVIGDVDVTHGFPSIMDILEEIRNLFTDGYNLNMSKFTYTFYRKEILDGWIGYLVNDNDPSDILVLRKSVLNLCPLPKWTKTYQKKVKKYISGLSSNYDEGIFRMDQRLYLLHDGDKVNYEVKDPYNCKHNDCYIQKIEGVIEWLNDIMTHPALNSRFPFL